MRINIILFNVLLLIFLFLLIYLYLYINYNNNIEKFTPEAIFNSSTTDTETPSDLANSNSVDMQEIVPTDATVIVSETYRGMTPTNSFNNVGIIMAINIARQYLNLTNVSNYGNGYYWINLKSGAKLLYVITDTDKNGGGWILALRLVAGSPLFNLTNDNKYRRWVSGYVTPNSKATAILTLPLGPNRELRYNQNYGLFDYNQKCENDFRISSVGAAITTVYNGSDNLTKIYDCRFASYSEYMFKEVMVMFHYLKNGINDSNVGYMRVPNRELDDYTSLNGFFKAPTNNIDMKVFDSFNTDNNTNLIRNFKLNIYNYNYTPPANSSQTSVGLNGLTNQQTPIMTIDCLLGMHGTIPASTQNSTVSPRLRYLLGIGVSYIQSRNTITSTGVFITVPDTITNVNQITIAPIAFELFIR